MVRSQPRHSATTRTTCLAVTYGLHYTHDAQSPELTDVDVVIVRGGQRPQGRGTSGGGWARPRGTSTNSRRAAVGKRIATAVKATSRSRASVRKTGRSSRQSRHMSVLGLLGAMRGASASGKFREDGDTNMNDTRRVVT